MGKINIDKDVNHLNCSVYEAILDAAQKSIKMKRGRHKKKSATWWTKDVIKQLHLSYKCKKSNYKIQRRHFGKHK